MVQYMRAHGLAGPWAASEHLLVCVHGGEGAAELVRYTKRLADRLKAPWTAIHIQTAGDRRAGEAVNDRVADTLRLAERLGGEALVLPGQRIADEVLAWARANNVTQIIIGSVRRSGWRDLLGGSLPRDLIRGADDIAIHVLPEGGETAPAKRVQARRAGKVTGPRAVPGRGTAGRRRDRRRLAAAGGRRASTTSRWCSCCRCWSSRSPTASGRRWWPRWRRPSPTTSSSSSRSTRCRSRSRRTSPACCCSRSWRWWPAGSRRAPAPRPWSPAQEAGRAAALYGFAKKLTGVATIDDLLWAAAHQVALMLKAEVVFLLPEDGRLVLMAAYPPEDQLDDNDLAAAEWCWRNDTPAGRGSDNLPGAPRLFLPLRTGRGKLGVVGIRKDLAGPLLTPAERRLLDALLDQTALAVDRVQLAARRRPDQAAGRDRAPAHGAADLDRARREDAAGLDPRARSRPCAASARSTTTPTREEMLATAQEEAERLDRFLDNLLDMTRLEAGALGPKREPVDVADAVGSALRRTSRLLAGHRVVTDLAGRPASGPARLRAAGAGAGQPAGERRPLCAQGQHGRDRRPGRAPRRSCWRSATAGRASRRTRLQRVFDPFYRASAAAPGKGVGLGLAVAKGFVEAMGGTIAAVERPGGGAVFRLSFPAELIVADAGAEAALAS